MRHFKATVVTSTGRLQLDVLAECAVDALLQVLDLITDIHVLSVRAA